MTQPPGSGAASPVTLDDVRAARRLIAGIAVRTPLKGCDALGERIGGAVHLKIETMQPTGAFKVRGAANRLLQLSPEERRRGVITVSTGNHGRAVAYVARRLGIRCVVCLSSLVPANKVAAIRALGAELDVGGENQDAAMDRAEGRALAEGLVMVSPFDDPAIIAGQGTIALEILEDVADAGTIVVPLSGGGLAAGVAVAAKALRPSLRVVAIGSERCPAMLRSLEAGRPVAVAEHESLADSLGGGIGLANRFTLALVGEFVDEIRVVGEAAIAAAMRFAFHEARLVVEGAAAVPIAALHAARFGEFPSPIVAVITGDNVEPDRLLAILRAAA
ncbi:MAG: pyridoxal-phosphate dependent enzyme [Alphaproteobacteria bacterium]|nr:pyridoxal-phosphate dependent enzyme [Alphaproteobacteria bacterium]